MSEQVKIREVQDRFALACQYPGQTQPQSAYIALDLRDRTMWAEYDPEIGNAVSMAVCHGHVRRYYIPPLVADVANRLMQDLEPLARRVCDGYESEWNGSNHVAKLSEDAQEAETEIEGLTTWHYDWDPTDAAQMQTACDWYYEVSDEVKGKTDKELEELAEQWDKDAEGEGVYITTDTLTQLKRASELRVMDAWSRRASRI